MVRRVKGRVRNGVIEIEKGVSLPENADVTVLVDEAPTQESGDAFERSAGGWVGLLDIDELLEDLRKGRKEKTPGIDLELPD